MSYTFDSFLSDATMLVRAILESSSVSELMSIELTSAPDDLIDVRYRI